LLASEPSPTPQQVTEAINPDPRKIMEGALPTCMECHEDVEDDESLSKLFELLDEIAAAERRYVETANRLDEVGQGVLLVDNQRFKFEDAKTHLIELAPLQHALDNSVVAEKVAKLDEVCSQVNRELDELEKGLHLRRTALIPIWLFALVFAGACYAKYRQLKAVYVKPLRNAQD
jgi:chemotaxis protein histidine kinase CheA